MSKRIAADDTATSGAELDMRTDRVEPDTRTGGAGPDTRTDEGGPEAQTDGAGHGDERRAAHGRYEDEASPLRYVAPVGRALFTGIFLMAALGHFSPQTIDFAAARGVPFAGLLVPASGVLALAGGLSVLLGYRARLGAWLLVLFLVPVTVAMHPFWAVDDAMTAQIEQAMFFKNVSMLGAALIIARVGAGPLSLDARARRG